MKKGLGEKLHTFFEKKVCQKTLAGCAANRKLGASQSKVFARLLGEAAGEKKGKAPRGSCLFSRAEPFTPGRSPHKKRGPQAARYLFRGRNFRQQDV
ncbi:hypothetical protein NSA36_15840 [Anaerotruncus colihominis]|nr:hypothetical protein [Anaerotruncus colihominis]